MTREEAYRKALIIVNLIKKKGGRIQDALSLVRSNPNLLLLSDEEIINRIYLIFNHNSIYAMLYVDNNTYSWSILNNGKFGTLFSINDEEKKKNYIIEMMIDSVEKYQKFINADDDKTLEDKIKQYNLIRKNETGYHIK